MRKAVFKLSGKESLLKNLPFFEHLSDDEKKQADSYSSVREYKKGSLIHSGGSECLGMIMLISGEIRTYILSEEGREITLFRLYPKDTWVLSASCVISQITFDTHMTAEADCSVLVLSSGFFSALCEKNIYARCYMYELLTERFSSVMWTMQQILFKGFDRRLAAFLISEYERTGLKQIKMTHEQIAQHTSSAREVVARMLKRFAADGLVEVKRGLITLKDTDALKRMI